jgi:hypothetical protein
MKNEFLLTVTINDVKEVYNVKSKAVARRAMRTLNAMDLPGVTEIAIDECGSSMYWEQSQVVKDVFKKSLTAE